MKARADNKIMQGKINIKENNLILKPWSNLKRTKRIRLKNDNVIYATQNMYK